MGLSSSKQKKKDKKEIIKSQEKDEKGKIETKEEIQLKKEEKKEEEQIKIEKKEEFQLNKEKTEQKEEQKENKELETIDKKNKYEQETILKFGNSYGLIEFNDNLCKFWNDNDDLKKAIENYKITRIKILFNSASKNSKKDEKFIVGLKIFLIH